jgi:hypothetical protein
MTQLSLPRASRLRIGGGLALALAAVVAFLVPGGARFRPDAPSGIWVLTSNTASVVAGLDPATAHALFASPGAYVFGGWPGATPAASWSSYAAFAVAVADGTISPAIHAVMYDPEGWAATPLGEQRDPAHFMRAFANLAHRQGYTVILTPQPNLTSVPGGACLHQPGESITAAYLRCGLPAEAARVGDVVDIQAQFLEGDAPAYAAVVTAATQQARAADPDVTVVAHLSSAYAFSASTLFAAWRSVEGVVDGDYLGIPDGVRAGVAVSFLQMVQSQPA